METLYKLKRFILYQLVSSLLIVIICTLISSAVSYRVLRGEMSDWLIDNNNKVLKQYSEIIDTLIISNSNEVYMQILTDLTMKGSMRYYLHYPLEENMLDTLEIRKYLLSIAESNPLITSVSIFYSSNNLLISNNKIRYDLFYEYRKEELQIYSNILNSPMSDKNSFLATADQDSLYISRPIVAEGKINVLFVIQYSLDAIEQRLKDIPIPEFSNFLIVNSEGMVILDTSPNKMHGQKLDKIEYSRIFEKPYGINTYNININEESNFVSYRNDNEKSWKYVSIAPTNLYMEPVSYILKNLIISIFVTIIAGIIFAILNLLWQSRPMHAIISLCNMANANIKVKAETSNNDLKSQKDTDTFSIIRKTLTNLMDAIEVNKEELRNIMPVLRDNFLNWLLSEIPIDGDEILDNMMLMKIDFPYKNFCVIAIKAKLNVLMDVDSDVYMDEFKEEYALAEVKMQFEDALNKSDSIAYFYKKGSNILGFVNFNYCKEYLDKLCENLSGNSNFGYNIYSCLGEAVQSITLVPCSVANVINGLEYSYIYPEKKLFTYNEIEEYKNSSVCGIQPMLRAFISSLKLKNYENSLEELRGFIKKVRLKGYDYKELDSLIHGISLEIQNESSIDLRIRNNIMDIYLDSLDIINFYEKLYEKIDIVSIIDEKFEDHSVTEKLVYKAKQHIRENLLNTQLSLQYIAEALGVTPGYLSRIFSEIEGRTFINYVTQNKMEYGRKLLLDTELTLDEISHKLNYASAQYFISRFKKYYSTTPSVYRKTYIQKEN